MNSEELSHGSSVCLCMRMVIILLLYIHTHTCILTYIYSLPGLVSSLNMAAATLIRQGNDSTAKPLLDLAERLNTHIHTQATRASIVPQHGSSVSYTPRK
jgi:hypothetical protein